MNADQVWMRKADDSGKWHLATEKQLVGEKSGRVHSRYYVTACAQQSLYSPYGQPEVSNNGPVKSYTPICTRCAKLLKVEPAMRAFCLSISKGE